MPKPSNDSNEPTLGVREPRKPKPPTLTGGAAVPLTFEYETALETDGRGVVVAA